MAFQNALRTLPVQHLRGRSFGPTARSHLRLFNFWSENRRSGTLYLRPLVLPRWARRAFSIANSTGLFTELQIRQITDHDTHLRSI